MPRVEDLLVISRRLLFSTMAEAPAAARPTIVALVPMKHTSIRVRGKNYRTFQGQPLCYWVLKTLRACQRIDQIVVDTDSD